jgi:SAM-dependent methyltransferase
MITACSPGPTATQARSANARGSSSISSRVSDLWRAPLTDLPVRDELIRQYIPLSPEMEVLEIGPGSGFPAYRMARVVASLTLLEVAAGNAAILQQRFAAVPNVEVVLGDLCGKGLGEKRPCTYDAAIAVEVFEYLSDPCTALHNLAAMLRPGGLFFMQFPNYENRALPTFYRTRHALEVQLRAAGFASWKIYSLRLSPWSQRLFHWLHELPLHLYRARQRSQKQRPQCPQRYDETWAFRHSGRLEAFKLPINLYWAAIMILMRLGGDVFRRIECGDEILGKNLFVVANRGGNGSVTE